MELTKQLKYQIMDLKLLKKDIAAHLGMSMPTLKTKLENPENLTISDVQKLGELDVSGIEPTSHAHPVHNVFREDAVRPGLDLDQVLENAPAVIEDQFKVPRIVE